MKEQELLNVIKDYLELKKYYCLRLNSGRLMVGYGGAQKSVTLCPQGTPDLFVIINGKPIFFEVKRGEREKKVWMNKVATFKKTGFITAINQREVNQYKQMTRIEQSGGDCYLVCSLNEVEDIVRKLVEKT
jgi:hypothetical protein